MHETILIVDDEEDIRLMIQGLLEDEGYKVITAGNSDQAYEMLERHMPHLVVQDIWLQGSKDDGIDILKNTQKKTPDIPFLMISGHGTIETAVSAIKLGAYDFIEKPFKSDRLLLMIHRALENSALKKQNKELKLQAKSGVDQHINQIPEQTRQILAKAAPTNSRLWIMGEAGTGKAIAAQYVHLHSLRADKPFMIFDCTGGDSERLGEVLFGTPYRPGLLELVDGGTLLLDNVLSLPSEMQGKVLMVLQESAYYNAGLKQKCPIDIRVISTSTQKAEDVIEAGRFRQDLFYRLSVVPMSVEPLRKRKQDIPALIRAVSSLQFTEKAMSKIQSYAWPGNIKQLHNVLEWIAIMQKDSQNPIDVDHLPPEINGNLTKSGQNDNKTSSLLDDVMSMSLRDARECFERYYLLSQVNKFDGNISKTSEFVGMERSALHRKLKSLEVFSDDKQNVA